MTPEQITEIKARLLAAHKEVTEIAEHGKGGRWIESSPEHPGSGPIIEASLIDALDLLAEVERLTAQVTAMAAENTRLVAKVADQAEDVMFLEALQAAGVDNWDGYSFAHEVFDEWQGGEPS